eukprot:gene1916-3721_t
MLSVAKVIMLHELPLSDGASKVIWTRQLMIDQGIDMLPATVLQDNLSTMAMIENGHSTQLDISSTEDFFIRDRVDAAEIQVKHLSTSQMNADILTKALQGELFRSMRDWLLNVLAYCLE